MAEQLASLRKKGGLIETALWTNPSPTAAFNAQAVTLSDSLQNYDYIRVYWKSRRGQTAETYADFPKATVIGSVVAIDANCVTISSYDETGQYFFIRSVRYASDTSLNISTAYRLNYAASNNVYVVPTQICGLK